MALSAALKAKSQPQDTPLRIYIGDSVFLQGVIQADGATQDLTGCTVNADILDTDGGSVLLTFTSTIPTPASGLVQMVLTPTQTNSIAGSVTSDGQVIGVWAATVTDNTDIVTFARGTVNGFFKRV